MRVKKTFPSQNLREISSRDQCRNNNNYSGTGTIATSHLVWRSLIGIPTILIVDDIGLARKKKNNLQSDT